MRYIFSSEDARRGEGGDASDRCSLAGDALGLVLGAGLAPPGSAPTPAPASSSPADADQTQGPVTTLKVVTRVVAISAVVKSKDGEPKTGLTKDDFVLKQDGKEVPIHYFSQGSDLPLTMP